MFRFATSTLFGLALTLGLSGAAQAGNYGYSSYGHTYHAPTSHYAPKYVPHASYPKTYVNVYTPYAPVYRPTPVTVIITKPAYCNHGYSR